MSDTRMNRMTVLLEKAFKPTILTIVNDSDQHQGHAGSPGTGESHYTIKIQADPLNRLSRIQAHRCIYDVLAPEFTTGLHAISLNVMSSQSN